MLKESIAHRDALKIILEQVKEAHSEEVSFSESLDRYISQDIFAPYPLPLHDNSAMDGYAVNSVDLKNATPQNPVVLELIDTISAGKKSTTELKNGQCIRIFTGAILPKGADAVVRQEDVQVEGNKVYFKAHVEPENDVRKRGSDLNEGQVVLKKGERVSPAAIGLLAALRMKKIKVYKKPSIYLIATGNELVDVDAPYSDNTIVNSNSYSLSAMAMQLGAEPIIGGIVKDDEESIRESFKKASCNNIVITTGGVSVGEYDLVKQVYAEMGVQWLFWKVKIRPGHPIAFGIYKNTLFFGLPGNPVSAMVTFDQFVRPSVMKMFGNEQVERQKFNAKCKSYIKKKAGIKHFIRGICYLQDGELYVESAQNQSSSAINIMVSANCYIILDENRTIVNPGEQVIVEIFKWW